MAAKKTSKTKKPVARVLKTKKPAAKVLKTEKKPKKMSELARKTVVIPSTAKKAEKKSVALPVVALNAKRKKEFKDVLLRLRDHVTGQIVSLKGDSLQRHDAANTEEDGTDAFERQFALNLVSSEQDALFDIDEALRRLDEGTYGVCMQCRKMVEEPRLKALPFVKMCVKCQSDMEKGKHAFRSDETASLNSEASEPDESADNSDSA